MIVIRNNTISLPTATVIKFLLVGTLQITLELFFMYDVTTVRPIAVIF
jgi:hypothetical protein